MSDVITLKNLQKSYGQVKALKNISFSVKTGEIFGLLGPNGAGKTTTIRCLTTLAQPDSGEILVGGVGLFKQKDKIWIKEKLDMEVLVMDIDGENYNNIVSVGLNGVLNYYNGISWKTHEILNGNLSTVSVKNNIIATIGMKFNYENVIIIGRRE